MMSLRVALLAAVLSAAAAGGEPALPPLQDAVAWPEPSAATPLRVNPPTFRWPAETAREFEIELARSPDYRDAQKVRADADFYRPLHPFARGRWYWRVRPAGGEWMKPASFDIPAELPTWDLPSWDELLARIPTGHPRIYLHPEEVDAYRARTAGSLHDFVRQWSARASRRIGADLEPRRKPDRKAPPAGDQREDALRAEKMNTWADKAGAGSLMDGAGEMAWLWMLTHDDRFAEEAKRRVLRATRMDPAKEFSDRVSDFANAAIVSESAIVYDVLYDRLSPAERSAIRTMLAARIAPLMRKVQHAPRRLFVAHGWQHTYLDAVMGLLAIYGDEPRARAWLADALKAFVAFYPWYGGVDGGSAEGTNYYTCCDMLSSLRARDIFLAGFGIDFAAQNPWYRANPFYLIYALPPGGTRSLFGASKFDPPPEDWRGRNYQYKDQWHLTVNTAAPAVRYIAVIQVAHPGAAWPDAALAGAAVRVGQWTISLEGGHPGIRGSERP